MNSWGAERSRQVAARITAGEVLVAPRDASWYDHPSTSAGPRSHCGGKRHVMTAQWTAVCSGAPLIREDSRPPGDVDPVLLCRRRACVKARRK